jgi:hypothetical protein
MAFASLVNGAPIDSGGRVLTDRGVGAVDTVQEGLPYTAAGALMLQTVGPLDGYNPYPMKGGKLFAIVSEIAPVAPSYMNGFVCDGATGALIFNLTLPIVGTINGWPVEANGTICAI